MRFHNGGICSVKIFTAIFTAALRAHFSPVYIQYYIISLRFALYLIVFFFNIPSASRFAGHLLCQTGICFGK
jgi:hypothetical protein